MDRRKLFGLILLTALALTAGCTDEGGTETLDFQATYESNALGGYTGDAEESLYAFPSNGDPGDRLRSVVVEGETPPSTVPGDFTLVVFRGVFPTGGYGLEVQNVTRRGDELTVEARYVDPEPGGITTQAFTAPAAYVPLTLPEGSYTADLIVTRVEAGAEGETVVEDEALHDTLEFTVGE